MKATIALAVAAVLSVAGCASGAPAGARNLGDAIATQAGAGGAQYRHALADLNGDGVDDAVVLLDSGESCGPSGCALLVFRGGRDGYNLVSRTTSAKAPVSIATTHTNGWSDLVVNSPGIGDVLVVFETYGYSANAALAMVPSAGQRAQAQIIIE